jgi:hypothetical protein
MSEPIFPSWTNRIRDLAGFLAAGAGLYMVVVVWVGFSPKTIAVGYAPQQPVLYSHALHAGKLGIDCRYCHTTVEEAAFAAIPPIATCMNCHQNIRAGSPRLEALRDAHDTGRPLEWVKVHDLPDYVYFDHSVHVGAGVGCVECHGRIDQMEVVVQEAELSMSWCLDCHRDPAPRLRPPDQVTRMGWVAEGDRRKLGERLMKEHDIQTSTDCSTCHR